MRRLDLERLKVKGVVRGLRHVRWLIIYLCVLLPVRLLFGVLLPPVLRYFWHNRSFLHLAQDDHPVYHRCECVATNMRYGSHPRETMDILIPSELENLGGNGESWQSYFETLFWSAVHLVTCYPMALYHYFSPPSTKGHLRAKEIPRALVFIHGGGMCAVDPSIQHHQLTAFVRAGFAVYSIAYPWAPESPFPSQVISTLKALSWIHRYHGRESVHLIGESAGGTLASSVAALLYNRDALEQFATRCHELYGSFDDITHWRYPRVDKVISWYGILDTQSWRGMGWLSWGLAWTVDAWVENSPYPRFLSSIQPHEVAEARKSDPFLTLVSMLDAGLVKKFPKTLIIVGETDPLGLLHSSVLAYSKLKEKVENVDVELRTYKAGHAFIGLNPFILVVLHGNKWRTELAKPATLACIDFLS